MSETPAREASIPFVKSFDFSYGEITQISPNIRRVIAKNPGPFTYTGSGTYIIGAAGALAVVDPGPEDAAHLDALLRALGGAPVSHILVTHTHSDHCGGARRLAAMLDAPILAASAHPVRDKALDTPALDEGADYSFKPDELLSDTDLLEGDDWTIEVVATPGHLSNHLCFGLKGDGALFTGDHVMGWATTVVAPPDGDMATYLNSLDVLLARDDDRYLPTHGAPIENTKPFVRAIKTHRYMRDGQILHQLRQGRATIREIVLAIYAGLDKRLHGAAALNVHAHLIRLVATGAVRTDGPPQLNGSYTAL